MYKYGINIYKPISMYVSTPSTRHHSSTDSLWAVGQRRFDVLSPVVKTSHRHHIPRRNWKAWGMDVVPNLSSLTRTKKKQEPVLHHSNSWCSFLLVRVHLDLMAGKHVLETFSGMHWNFWMRYMILLEHLDLYADSSLNLFVNSNVITCLHVYLSICIHIYSNLNLHLSSFICMYLFRV